jgi:ATP-dependent protease HslVU (ClpYQ) peptidase subunit
LPGGSGVKAALSASKAIKRKDRVSHQETVQKRKISSGKTTIIFTAKNIPPG